MNYPIPHILISIVSTILAIYVLRHLALRINLVDIPNDRKSHEGHVPLIGGIAMYIGVVVSLLITSNELSQFYYFIAVTGIFLIAKRQGGFNKLYTKVQETDFAQRYHVILGRIFLAPILIIASTGVYLSAEKFSLFPDHSLQANSRVSSSTAFNPLVFENTTLKQVRKLTFPFSDNSSDYFELALNDRELLVDQYTGEVVGNLPYPFVQLASQWSKKLHTGQGNLLWSFILLISSLSLLFFMYTGFVVSLRRRGTKRLIEDFTKDEAEYILLVGSETGNTFVFAKTFFNALLSRGRHSFCEFLDYVINVWSLRDRP